MSNNKNQKSVCLQKDIVVAIFKYFGLTLMLVFMYNPLIGSATDDLIVYAALSVLCFQTSVGVIRTHCGKYFHNVERVSVVLKVIWQFSNELNTML